MGQGNPVMKGTLIAVVGLVYAGLLGWGMMGIGANRLRAVEQEKEPLRQAVSFIAGEGMASVNEVGLAVANKNWGETQKPLRRVDEAVSALEKSATPDTQSQVALVRSALREAQEAAGEQDAGTAAKLDMVTEKLRAMQVK